MTAKLRSVAATPRPVFRIAHWPRYVAGAAVLLYVLVFVRGLGWQWWGIVTASPATVPVVASAPTGAAPPASQRAVQAPQAPQAAQPAVQSGQTAAKVPLPPSDEPPPRNATDKYGVYYDENGVAVMGLDVDPSGVYNVPSGRQLRIGGPQGALFDVEPGGKLKPATAIREQPQ
jgi:hypothetical protein